MENVFCDVTIRFGATEHLQRETISLILNAGNGNVISFAGVKKLSKVLI